MNDPETHMQIRTIGSMSEVSAQAWDACAGQSNPFVRHGFLSALEDSGSATAESGWATQHVLLEDSSTGALLGAAPLYVKNHSYGEYVFDWGWADAYERAGGRYYPKAQVCVPFTPATGPRLLLGEASDSETHKILGDALIAVAQQLNVSSLHITFPNKSEFDALGELEHYEQRLGVQYHWENQGYHSFEDFLARLNSRKRKAVKKERREVAALDVEIRVLSGHDMTEALWDAFYAFYMNTADRKWGQAYLTRSFFSLLGERCADDVVMVMCFEHGQPVAGALNLRGGDTLYGRNWGCLDDHKFLHFEACYYQAIDYAIAHGLQRVEAGAQGSHKVQRGYLPSATFSLHWIADPGLRKPVANFVRQEREQIEYQIAGLLEHESPYRKADQ